MIFCAESNGECIVWITQIVWCSGAKNCWRLQGTVTLECMWGLQFVAISHGWKVYFNCHWELPLNIRLKLILITLHIFETRQEEFRNPWKYKSATVNCRHISHRVLCNCRPKLQVSNAVKIRILNVKTIMTSSGFICLEYILLLNLYHNRYAALEF